MAGIGEHQQELQKTFMQLEMGKKQLEELVRQAHFMEQAVVEKDSTIAALRALEDAGEENEILVPLGSDSFIKARILNKDEILVGVGGGVSLEKKRLDALKTLEARRDDLRRKRDEIAKSAQALGAQVEQLNMMAEAQARHLQQHNH